MRTSYQLWLGLGGLTALLALIAITLFTLLRDIGDQTEHLRHAGQLSAASREMQIHLLAYALAVRSYAQTGQARFQTEAVDHRQRLQQDLAEYRSLALDNHHQAGAAQFERLWQEYLVETERLLAAWTGPVAAAQLDRLADRRIALGRLVDEQLQAEAVDTHDRHSEAAVRQVRAAARVALILLLVGGLIAAATSVITARTVLSGERAARASEARFRSVLEHSLDAAYRRDLQTDTYDYLSPAIEQVMGVTREQIQTMPSDVILNRIHPDDREMVRQTMAPDRRAPQGCIEYRFQDNEGQYRWLADHYAVQTGEDGRPRFLSGVVRDITQQKQVEHAAGEMRRKLDSALIAGDVATFELETGSGRVWGDARFAQLFSLNQQEPSAPLAVCLAVVHPEDRERVAAAIARTAETGADYEQEHRIISRGSARWVIARGQAQRDSAGQVSGIAGVVVDVTQRKQTEAALRRSETRYGALFEAIEDGLCIVEVMLDSAGAPTDLRFVEANPTFTSATGLPNPVGRTARELVPHLDPGWLLICAEVATSGAPQRLEHYAKPVQRWLEIYAFRFGPAENRQLAVFFKDVTERRQVEDALRQSEATLNAVLDALPVGVVIADRDGRVIRHNWAHQEIWGDFPRTSHWLEYQEWVGYWPDTGARIQAREWAMARALLQGEVVKGQLVECERFGTRERRLYFNNAAPVRDADGNIIAGVVAEMDATELITAERALRENEQRLRLAGEAAGAGFWTWDLTTHLAIHDPICAALFGLPPGATVSAAEVMAAIHPEDRARVDRAVADAVAGDGRYEVEFRVQRSDASVRWVAGLGRVIRHADGNVRLTGLNWDITRQKEAEAERATLLESERAARSAAERANLLKDEFLANVSHELRTPLNAILGWAELLAMDDVEPDAVQEGVSAIRRNARAQAQLVEDLLDMSRITSGKVRLELRSVDLVQVLDAALETMQPAAEAKGVRLECDVAPNVPPVQGDPHRLQQVCWNLLSNAIKFTPVGGRVTASILPAGDHVRIEVEDTGIGIQPEFLPFVFERFRQADASTTRKIGGLGLGLAIVKHLVELHGGRVSVTSAGLNRGSAFLVELPRVSRPPDQPDDARPGWLRPAEDQVIRKSTCLTGITVLAVDDEPDTLVIVRRVLEENGAQVLTAHSGAEALEILRTARPQVLLSDIGMPEMDGFELIRRVRALGETEVAVRAAALTAFARSEDRTRALLAGFEHHLSKPVEPRELVAVVASMTGRLGGSTGLEPA